MEPFCILVSLVAAMVIGEVHSQTLSPELIQELTRIAHRQGNGQIQLQQEAQRLALTNRNVGQPEFQFSGLGSGPDPGNFQGGYSAGVGVKVYESKDGRLSAGASAIYNGGLQNTHYQLHLPQPHVTYGAGLRYNFHGRR